MDTVSPPAAAVPAPTTRVGYVILIAAAAALGGFLFGFDTAVINGAVLALKSVRITCQRLTLWPNRSRSDTRIFVNRCTQVSTPAVSSARIAS